MSNWRPRSSKVGGYFACSARVAYDRFFPAGCDPSSSYADLGTLIHYQLMANDLRLEFPDGKEAPTSDQWENAAKLFKDPDDCSSRVVYAGGYAAERVPAPPQGATWLAETHYDTPTLTGSIDFISSDGSVIGDLKTTSRKPEHGKVKASHFYQLLCYAMLAESAGAKPKEAWVLYVGSLKDFDLLVRFPLDSDAAEKMKGDIRRNINFWMDDAALKKYAVRTLGHHCEGDFCPHRSRCRDLLIPDPGESRAPAAVKIVNPFEKTT